MVSVSWVPRLGDDYAGYRLEALVGSGGMSIVYRARHLSLDRTVALKLLSPELSEDESFRERFLRESRLAASLDHPNVIPIYEAGETDGVFYIAMRFVAGRDLKSLLKQEGPLDGPRTATIISQVAGALEAAHSQGLVHRDVKPANVLIASGLGADGGDHVYLSDFGVVKQRASQPLTKTGIFVGTADYASPEQIEGKTLDGRADVYSLGCVLYECLTGAPAYDRDSEVALMYAHLLEPPPTISDKRPDLSPEIDAVLAKGMAKNRDERNATPTELAQATRGVLVGDAAPATATRGGQTVLSAPQAPQTVMAGAPAMPPPPVTPRDESSRSPDGDGAPPPRGGTATEGRKRTLIFAGIAALLVAGAVVAAILTMGGDSEAGDTTTTGATTPVTVLDAVVPTALTRGCTKRGTPVAPAVETYECTPTETDPSSYPDESEISFYASGENLAVGFEDATDGLTEAPCGAVTGERAWIHVSTGQRGGRRACFTDDEGRSVIVWTHEKLGSPDHVDTLGIGREPGRTSNLFRSWWNAVNDDIGKCRPAIAEQACLDAIAKVRS
jgi:hypothetical protein